MVASRPLGASLGWPGSVSPAFAAQVSGFQSIFQPVADCHCVVLTLTISVGIQDRPSAAPLTPEPFNSDYVLFASPKPSEAFAAVSTAIFSFAGTPAFFHIVSEMRDPRMYTRSVAICQTFMIAIYVVIGVVVYIYCGSYVSTPALGSAGTLMKKVCYGLAAPGLMVSTALFVHVGLPPSSNQSASKSLDISNMVCVVYCQVRLPPHFARFRPSHPEHANPLGSVDRVHRRKRHYCLHCGQRHPYPECTCVSCRRCGRYPHVYAADGVDVAP